MIAPRPSVSAQSRPFSSTAFGHGVARVEDTATIRLTPEIIGAARKAEIDCHKASRSSHFVPLDLTVRLPTGTIQTVRVHLITKPQHRGQRHWFLCPRCDRRCAVLHSPAPSNSFACRTCYGLRYRSQYVNRYNLVRFFRLMEAEFRVLDALEREESARDGRAQERAAWRDRVTVNER